MSYSGGVPAQKSYVRDAIGARALVRYATFSAFFLIGFLSVPFWGIAVGVKMEIFGFSIAFSIIATSYLLGAALMSLVEDKRLNQVIN